MADSNELKEFKSRFERAEAAKNAVIRDVREVYHYCLDGKADDPHAEKSYDIDLFSSLPSELAGDFASDLATYFMPEYAEWVNFILGSEIDETYADVVTELVEARKESVQNALSASNLYGMANSVFMDAAHGTIAMWQHDMGPGHPMVFEPVHFSELYINVGPMGRLDDRFRRQEVTWEYLFETFPALKKVKRFDGFQKDAHKKTGKLTEGFWRYSDFKSGKWRSLVEVEGHQVSYEVLDGLEEVPLLVGRFNPVAKRPWGFGPARRLLPDIRTFNEINQMGLEGVDRALDPAFVASGNNQMGTDFSDGVEGGVVYDLPPGASLNKLDLAPNVDLAFFSADRFEALMRSGFFQDGPRQRGLTPPSATQWLDEARRIQKRMGRPAGPIFDEFIFHLIVRTDHVLSENGVIEPGVTYDGKLVSLEPINPLTFAQRQDELMGARALLNDIYSFAPNEAPMLVDMPATFRNMRNTQGDRILKIRTQQEIEAIQQQQMKMQAQMQAQMQGAADGSI